MKKKNNLSNEIDKFFEEFQKEIDAHFDKVFKMINDIKKEINVRQDSLKMLQ